MIHLAPLPGSPRFSGKIDAIRESALRDAYALRDGGVHGLMIENFGDVPFFPARVPAITVAHMTAIASEVRTRVDLPLGINMLRNDGLSALAVAHACGAQFIRVNVLCGVRVADQGLLHGIAHELLRDRMTLPGGSDVKVLADVDVKHSAPLGVPRDIADEVDDTIHRGLADALVVSGAGTGKSTDAKKAKAVKSRAGNVPVFVGSGVTASTVPGYASFADGFIVGTAFKRDGNPRNPVETERVKALLAALD
jgi:membrane complex biogenesis BtpA family protein